MSDAFALHESDSRNSAFGGETIHRPFHPLRNASHNNNIIIIIIWHSTFRGMTREATIIVDALKINKINNNNNKGSNDLTRVYRIFAIIEDGPMAEGTCFACFDMLRSMASEVSASAVG
jgi:hypothetical protein